MEEAQYASRQELETLFRDIQKDGPESVKCIHDVELRSRLQNAAERFFDRDADTEHLLSSQDLTDIREALKAKATAPKTMSASFKKKTSDVFTKTLSKAGFKPRSRTGRTGDVWKAVKQVVAGMNRDSRPTMQRTGRRFSVEDSRMSLSHISEIFSRAPTSIGAITERVNSSGLSGKAAKDLRGELVQELLEHYQDHPSELPKLMHEVLKPLPKIDDVPPEDRPALGHNMELAKTIGASIGDIVPPQAKFEEAAKLLSSWGEGEAAPVAVKAAALGLIRGYKESHGNPEAFIKEIGQVLRTAEPESNEAKLAKETLKRWLQDPSCVCQLYDPSRMAKPALESIARGLEPSSSLAKAATEALERPSVFNYLPNTNPNAKVELPSSKQDQPPISYDFTYAQLLALTYPQVRGTGSTVVFLRQALEALKNPDTKAFAEAVLDEWVKDGIYTAELTPNSEELAAFDAIVEERGGDAWEAGSELSNQSSDSSISELSSRSEVGIFDDASVTEMFVRIRQGKWTSDDLFALRQACREIVESSLSQVDWATIVRGEFNNAPGIKELNQNNQAISLNLIKELVPAGTTREELANVLRYVSKVSRDALEHGDFQTANLMKTVVEARDLQEYVKSAFDGESTDSVLEDLQSHSRAATASRIEGLVGVMQDRNAFESYKQAFKMAGANLKVPLTTPYGQPLTTINDAFVAGAVDTKRKKGGALASLAPLADCARSVRELRSATATVRPYDMEQLGQNALHRRLTVS